MSRKPEIISQSLTEASKSVAPGLLCFDSETTNHGELLELSVFDIEGVERFHQYFKPRAKSWPTDIHHITPEMVSGSKRFFAYRNEIQRLLWSVNYLLGCALSNDLHTLRRYGVRLKDRHKVLDIQDWFWLLNDCSDRRDRRQTGLAAIAAHYGLGFGDLQAHSATADTKLTLACFKAMADDFIRRYVNLKDYPELKNGVNADNLDVLNRLFVEAYKNALQIYRMRNSAGFIGVLRREQGFVFKYTRYEQLDREGLVLSVEVNDRIKAEEDLKRHFESKQVKGYTGHYFLEDSDFEFIRNYTNNIDIETFREREKSTEKTKKPGNSAFDIVRRIFGVKNKGSQSKENATQPEKNVSIQKRKKSVKTRKPSALNAAKRAMRVIKNR